MVWLLNLLQPLILALVNIIRYLVMFVLRLMMQIFTQQFRLKTFAMI